jgi:hypothetical protein
MSHSKFQAAVNNNAEFDIDIDIDIFVNCNWVDTRWQYTFTHKQYTELHNQQQNNTNNNQTTQITIWKNVGRA